MTLGPELSHPPRRPLFSLPTLFSPRKKKALSSDSCEFIAINHLSIPQTRGVTRHFDSTVSQYHKSINSLPPLHFPPSQGMAQHSNIARSAIMTSASSPDPATLGDQRNMNEPNGISSTTSAGSGKEGSLMPPPKTVVGRALGNDLHSEKTSQAPKGGVGSTLTDTPISTAPPSPQM